jgi:hypothetical protein
MKIKGPPDYSVPPAPQEPEGVDKKAVSKFETEPASDVKVTKGKQSTQTVDSFESSLREISKASGPQGIQGEQAVDHIVDTVLEEVMGKDFLSHPDASRIKKAISPLIGQDEQLMTKLNSILNRLEKS